MLFYGRGCKMRKLFLVIALLILFFSGCKDKTGNGKSSDPKKVIKLSHSHQNNFSSEIHTAAWIFQKYVNDFSETLEVRIYPANALGQEREVYEGIQLGGGADCIISGTAILNNFHERIGVLDLPFLWQDYNHVHKVLDGKVGDILAGELKKQGFHVLAWMDSWGYRNVVTSDKAVNDVAGLKGLKIRTIESPVYIGAVNLIGANATPMAFGEVYSSLQTGVLDGFEHSASVVKANKFYEVADHIVLTRHLFGPLAFIFSQSKWENLTDQEKNVVKDAAIMARDVQRALAPEKEAQAMKYLKEAGMTIHNIDMSSVKQKARSLQETLAGENNAAELLKIIRNTK
jgi:tripartite ATP-independent transporter DctP family solute receptor